MPKGIPLLWIEELLMLPSEAVKKQYYNKNKMKELTPFASSKHQSTSFAFEKLLTVHLFAFQAFCFPFMGWKPFKAKEWIILV